MAGVFLSYAREDLPFVRHLYEALSAAGRDSVWDQDHDAVPFGAPYRSEIAAAIAGSEKFIFVISPDSLDSSPCAGELAEAEADGKEVIPLLRRAARESQQIPKAVAERNWIFFDDDADFDRGFGQLIQALDTDLAWVKEHTRLSVRAREWAGHGSDRSGLLRGAELRTAEAWLAKGDAHPLTLPTASQRQFVAASRRAADRTARLQRTVLAVGLAIAVALATVALLQRNQAIRARDQAIHNETVAEALQLGSSDTPLAAQLNLAAFRMQSTADVASRLISTENSPLSSPLADSTMGVSAMAFSLDGHTLAAGGIDGTVRLWDVADSGHPRALSQPLSHAGIVYSLAFSPDGHILASGAANGTLWLWDVADPSNPQALSQPESGSSALPIFSVTFSPDGRTLAIGGIDGAIQLWDVANPAHPQRLGNASGGNSIYALTFSRVGHILASGDAARAIRLWNVANPAHLRPIGQRLPNTQTVYSLAFSRNSRTLATGGFNGTIRLWDVTDPAHPQALGQPMTGSTDSVNAVAFSPDGRVLATGGFDGDVRLWDVADPAHPQALGQPVTGNTGQIHSLAFSPDGRTLAAGTDAGNVRLWNVTNPADPRPLAQPQNTIGSSSTLGTVFSLAFSPDGRTLAAGGYLGYVDFWNVADLPHTPRVLDRPIGANATVYSLAFSPDGRTLATGDASGNVRLWDVADPAHPPIGVPLTRGVNAILSVAFSRVTHTLGSGDANGTIRLWDVADPVHPRRLGQPQTANLGSIDSLAFSPNGHRLASGDANGTVGLWDVTHPARPRPLGQPLPGHTSKVNSVAFGKNSSILASASSDGTIRLWNLNVGFAIERICTRARNDLTPQQWLSYIPSRPYQSPCAH